MKKIWWKEAIGYQVYPRSFMDSNGDGIGDIRGIISKLDYLKDLGVDVIWLCPMYKSPNDDNGYDISDYEDIMSDFGTMDDFDELLREIHKRDMKAIIDLVINHTSDEHQWFIESKSSKDNPKRDWYIWRDGKNGEEPNNWESIFGGSAWEYNEITDDYYLHLFTKKQPDLNWENPEVRKELYSMINWWLDKGIDGFRVDAISHIKKEEGLKDMPKVEGKKYVSCFQKHMNVDGIHSFLDELKNETFAKYDIMTVGEANGVQANEANLWVGEEEGKFNMVFQFEHTDLWGSKDKKLDVKALRSVLSKWQDGLYNVGWNALFIENHDMPRVASKWGNPEKFWKESCTALALMYFMQQGTPFIYQGQEIGMTNMKFKYIEDYNDVKTINTYKEKVAEGMSEREAMDYIMPLSRDNTRTPMQWNNSDNAGFTSGNPWLKVNSNYKNGVNVEEQQKDGESILNFYKKMIRLRKEHKALVYGKYDAVLDEHENIYSYTRSYEDEKYLIITNLSDREVIFECDKFIGEKYEVLLSNYRRENMLEANIINLKPYEAMLCKR